MFALPRIIALISLCGMPVQLKPTYNNQKTVVGPKSSGNTTPRTLRFPEQFFRQVYNKPVSGKTLKELQYAPLHVDLKSTMTTRQSSITTTTATYGKLYNEHLEPRTPDAKHEYTKCYKGIPVEHVDVMTSVSRSPGHNAIYRGFPIIVPRDKPFKAHRRSQDVIKKPMPLKKVLKKLNFIKPFPMQQNLELLPIASTTVPFLADNLHAEPLIMSNQQYIINPDIVDKDIDLTLTKPKRLPFSPYNKLHRLHLNIARVYSPGAVPQKSPSYSGVYSLNVDSDTAQLQADQPPILHLSKQSHAITGKSANSQK